LRCNCVEDFTKQPQDVALKWLAPVTIVDVRDVRAYSEETKMSWKTPKIVEVQVGMEINMYACAARK
jgi:coenzyme PQQ precursor peptide PqqA